MLPQPRLRFSRLLSFLLLGAALGCREDVTAPTGPGLEPALSTGAATGTLSFRQVSAGSNHTCGVAINDRAYCWGRNFFGTLGDGTNIDRLTPVAVSGGLRFRQVSAGVGAHSCGVTTDNRAYCWGHNLRGELGDGTTATSLTPIAVAGGRRFRQISAGAGYTCAVNTNDVAFCWGESDHLGALGTGGGPTTIPVRVARGLRWRSVSAGDSHTCGATTDDRGYCWGENSNHQLGDGTSTGTNKPVAVAGGLRFRQVVVGLGFVFSFGDPITDEAISCGVTTTNRAYCWGSGSTAASSFTPREVAGGRRYRLVTAGRQACGVNLGNGAYCWGLTPALIPGGLKYSDLSTSGSGNHTCGVTTDNRAYCWGDNSQGQLGDGTTTPRPTPVAVAGVM